jgi:hypothetical protein
VDYKINLDASLAVLSWHLFIGGQVLRILSGSIQISLYKTGYNTISYFNYDYALISILDLASFHGLLPEQASGVPMSWVLVFVPLLVAPEILSES